MRPTAGLIKISDSIMQIWGKAFEASEFNAKRPRWQMKAWGKSAAWRHETSFAVSIPGNLSASEGHWNPQIYTARLTPQLSSVSGSNGAKCL